MKKISSYSDIIELVNRIKSFLGEIPEGFSINLEVESTVYDDMFIIDPTYHYSGKDLYSYSAGIATFIVADVKVKIKRLPEKRDFKIGYGKITDI